MAVRARIRKKLASVSKIRELLFARLEDFDVVSFDVFDTLLRRRVHPPDVVKEPAARYFSHQLAAHGVSADPDEVLRQRYAHEGRLRGESYQAGFDPECKYDHLMRVLVAHFLPDADAHAIDELTAQVIGHELRLELLVLGPNPAMGELLADLAAAGKKVVITSDMYFSAKQVERLLAENHIDTTGARFYVSSEYGYWKGSGRLFRCWLDELGVAPERAIHIGDNPVTDFEQPRRQGLHAIQYVDRVELSRQDRLAAWHRLAERRDYWKGAYTLEFCKPLHRHPLAGDDFFYDYGRQFLGPAYAVYLHAVIEKVEQYGIDHVLFVAREGFLFQKIYEILHEAIEPPARPTTCYACLSRQSTGLASVHRLSVREFQIGTDKSRPEGILSVLKTYGLPREPFASLAAEHGIADLAEPIADFWGDARLRNFLADTRVQEAAAACRKPAVRALESYLGRCGFWGRGRKVALVDVGWQGSIQYNLLCAFGHREDFPSLFGLYFGQHARRNYLQYAQAFAEGLMFDFRRRQVAEQSILDLVQVFEQGARAPHGSTTGYEPADEARGGLPVFKADDAPDRQDELRFDPALAALQQGVLDFARAYAGAVLFTGYRAEEVKPYVLAHLARYICLPRKHEARTVIGLLRHAEDLGETNLLKLGIDDFSPWSGPLQWARFLRRCKSAFWKQGSLRLTGVPALPWLSSLALFLHRGLRP